MNPVHVVWGNLPEIKDGVLTDSTERTPLEVFLEQVKADQYLLEGLVFSFGQHVNELAPGGQITMLVTRGQRPTEDNPNPPTTFGSFVVSNPADGDKKADRHEWEFTVERRQTEPLRIR